MIAATEKLGLGIYTPQEAALYARVPTQTIKRWVLGNKQGDPVVRRQIEDGTDTTITFLDFIQSLAVRAIRTQYKSRGVSLQKIRQAADVASQKYDVEYPFARPHSTFVITEGRHAGELVLKLGEDRIVQLTGKNKDQRLLGPIAEFYLDAVRFDDDEYAAEYRPWGSQDGGEIVMNPHLRFGEPIVEQCGYSARTLWDAAIAEGGVEAAAEAYGVKPHHIKLACTYYDHILNTSS